MAKARRYRVRWTEGAKRDVASIAGYVARDSQQRADALRDALVKAAARLAAHPMRGRIVPELHDFGVDLWRELIVDNFRIVYRVDAGRVFVSLVLDARRDVEHALLERLIGS